MTLYMPAKSPKDTRPMPRLAYLLSLTFLLGLLAGACGPVTKYDPEPTLEWRDYEFEKGTDGRSSIKLTTYFTDGDGNIGRDTALDRCNPDDYDLLIYYFERVDPGVYEEVFPPDSCFPFHSVLPDLMPEGQNKTLSGEIIYNFSYAGLPQNTAVDSIRFELQLQDRDRNRSERVHSPSIALPQ